MLEMNALFDQLHKDYDTRIQSQWTIQKHNMNVYNAQFLSRYSFVVDQVKTREMEVLEAIQQRGQEIGKFFILIIFNLNFYLKKETQMLSVLETRDLLWMALLIMLD
jgi:hypothetical protein